MSAEKFFTALVIVIFSLVAFILYITWEYREETPRLSAECEARGGMLIETRDGHACVGRPSIDRK